MLCLCCGRCCILPEIRPLPDGSYKPAGAVCPYLVRDGDQTSCRIHGQTFQQPWEETACGRFSQDRHPDRPCRVGLYFRATPSPT